MPDAVMDPGRLLRPVEVQERLAISKSHLHELLVRGEVPSLRIGRSRRVVQRDLDAYLDRLRRDTGVEGG